MRDTQSREPRERPAPQSRSERGFVESEGDGVWFRLNVGRSRKADPKWILPLICRLGQVTKAEIGPIRIFDDETKFEIVGHAAAAFADAVKLTGDDEVQIEPSSAPRAGEATHPMRAKRDGFRADRAPREDRPQREFGDRPPREKREFSDRPPREPRADARPPREDFKQSARDDARAARYQQRDNERAKLAADPVYSSLGTPETARPHGPPPAHPSGLNRKERRDAARAEGKIAPLGTETPNRPAAPKRKWTPDAERAPRVDRPDRRPRPEGARSEHTKPEGFKPRGAKPEGAKPFKARGDKPFGKSFAGKPGGKPFRGKPAGKPAGKRDQRG
jgi:ATP-dependent RNA helicase DeaD